MADFLSSLGVSSIRQHLIDRKPVVDRCLFEPKPVILTWSYELLTFANLHAAEKPVLEMIKVWDIRG